MLNFPRHLFAAVVLLILGVTPALAAAETLTGQTGRPNSSIFVPGDTIPIQFDVTAPAGAAAGITLNVKVEDEEAKTLDATQLPVPTGQSAWTTTYLAPNTRLGFYRVFAALSDGVTLPAMGSRKAGYLTYCVVPDPASRPVFPPEGARFGMTGGFNGSINLAPYLGYNWVNGPGSWIGNEPDSAGEFAAARARDRAAGQTGPSAVAGATKGYEGSFVIRNGQKVPWPIYPVFPVFNPPKWAVIPDKKVFATGPLRDEAYPAWLAYCTAFAQSVVEDYPNLDEHVYQITWEPDWFSGTNDQFMQIYRIAREAIRGVDSKAIIAGPTKSGVGDFNMDQEAGWFTSGFGSLIDAYTIHPYISMPAETHNYVDKLRLLVRFPALRAGHAMPVFSTEQGFQTGEDPALELNQARYLVRSCIISLGEGVQFYLGFFVHDYKGEPGFGYFYNLRDDEQFGTGIISPKPIVPAYAAATYLLDGHKTVGPLDYVGDTAIGYAFQRGNDVVLALWDYGDQPRTISLSTGTNAVDVYDWMGNRRHVLTPAGQLPLTLTQEPVYVRGVAPGQWGAGASRLLNLDQTALTATPGGEVRISGTVRNAGAAPLAGALHLALPAGWIVPASATPVRVPAGASHAFQFVVHVAPGTPLGTEPVDLTFVDGKALLAQRRLRADVKPPLRVTAITPATVTGGTNPGELRLNAVRVSLSSTLDQTVTGSLALKLQGAHGDFGAAPFRVESSSDPIIEVPCSGLAVEQGQSYTAELRGKTNGGYPIAEPVTFGLATAAGAGSAPPLDGAPLHWAGASVVPLSGTVPGKAQFAWDKDALYVAAQIPDAPGSTAPANLQIGINLDPARVERSTGDVVNDTLARRRFSVLSLTNTADGPQAARIYTFNGDKLHQEVIPYFRLSVAIHHADGATVYEAAIPWIQLAANQAPDPNSVIGIALAANVPATAGPAPTATLFQGIFPAPDSSQLGYLFLCPAPASNPAIMKPIAPKLIATTATMAAVTTAALTTPAQAGQWSLPPITAHAPQVWKDAPNWTYAAGNPMTDSGATWGLYAQNDVNPDLTAPYTPLAQTMAFGYFYVWGLGPQSAHAYRDTILSTTEPNNVPESGPSTVIRFHPPAPGSYSVDIAGTAQVQAETAGHARVTIYILGAGGATATQLAVNDLNNASPNAFGHFPNTLAYQGTVNLKQGNELAVRIQTINPGPGSAGNSSITFSRFVVKSGG